MIPISNPDFDRWLSDFRPRARAAGITDAALQSGLRGAGFIPGVVERDRNQTEFTRSLEDYLAIAVSDERLEMGRARMASHGPILDRIAARYGVEPHVIAAIWGLESFFGTRRGDIPVISATATLAFDGRRGRFFENQLIAALRIIQNGDTAAANMTGSWAGAMGHTQFIPTTYEAYAVDFTGNGRRDIWSEDPSDALASAANYLARMGWRRGQPWGLEVRVPAGFDTSLAGRGSSRPVSDWTARGVRRVDGSPLPDHGAASVILPAGAQGPAFLTFANFTVITRYNNSENYVIGIGHLGDRLRGGPPIRAPFPPDRYGFTIADRRELQRRLSAAGFDTGGVDGIFGRNTEAAIRDWQASRGLPVTGEPSRQMLDQLTRS